MTISESLSWSEENLTVRNVKSLVDRREHHESYSLNRDDPEVLKLWTFLEKMYQSPLNLNFSKTK